MALFDPDAAKRGAAAAFFAERGNPDAAAALILAMRFVREPDIPEALEKITGETLGADWFGWMLWQEAHPEIRPFDGFALVHAWAHSRIDPNFQLFLDGRKKHEIRIEEIVWGGVVKDGIPALTHPRLVGAAEAGLPERRRPRLRHRDQRRRARLSAAHPRLARNAQRHDRRRRSEPRLLHAVRRRNPVRDQGRRDGRSRSSSVLPAFSIVPTS